MSIMTSGGTTIGMRIAALMVLPMEIMGSREIIGAWGNLKLRNLAAPVGEVYLHLQKKRRREDAASIGGINLQITANDAPPWGT